MTSKIILSLHNMKTRDTWNVSPWNPYTFFSSLKSWHILFLPVQAIFERLGKNVCLYTGVLEHAKKQKKVLTGFDSWDLFLAYFWVKIFKPQSRRCSFSYTKSFLSYFSKKFGNLFWEKIFIGPYFNFVLHFRRLLNSDC